MQAREGFFFVFWYPYIIVGHNADTTPLFAFYFFVPRSGNEILKKNKTPIKKIRKNLGRRHRTSDGCSGAFCTGSVRCATSDEKARNFKHL